MSDSVGGEKKANHTVASLNKRLTELESEVANLELADEYAADAEVTYAMFLDVLNGIIESLVRTRSAGAFRTAELLKDKYLDPEASLDAYGEGFVKTGSLYATGKEQ